MSSTRTDSGKKRVVMRFPDASFIAPNPSGSPGKEDTTPVSVVRDTYFASIFREWDTSKRFGYNVEVHDGLRDVILDYIQRSVAARMVTDDIEKSEQATGVRLGFDRTRVDSLADSMLELKLFKDLACCLGIGEYAEDIVQREMDRLFGSAPIQASEKRKQAQKSTEEKEWLKTTIAGIHNYMRDTVSALSGLDKSLSVSAKMSKPADPHLAQMLKQAFTSGSSRDGRSDYDTSSDSGGIVEN